MRIWLSYRRFRRYRQIINILVKNGFGGILEFLRLRRLHRLEKQGMNVFPSPRAKRLRIALTELGPTFIKVGQMLSTRADIVPADIIQELRKLQDQVPPVNAAQIRGEIESELKSPINAIFSEFDETPLAAASIGQVHRAKLKTGEDVVIKIQRPKIRRMIEEDMDILLSLAKLAERHLPEAEVYNPVGLINEFARSIRNELDYTLEARNMERFARNFEDDENVYIPKVYWEYTSGRVLTMELIKGIKVSEADELRKAGFDPKRVAVKGAEAYLKQIFLHGFFHGDPHPGNIFVMPGEVIGFMDFGIAGRLSTETLTRLNNIIIAIARKNPGKIAEELLQISVLNENSDIDDLKTDLADLIDQYYGVSLNQFQVSELIRELGEISSRYRVKMNRQIMLLGKVLAGIEGMGRQLDPDFNILPIIEPFAKRLMIQRLSPKDVLDKSAQIVRDYADLVTSLPKDLRIVVDKAKNGKLRMEFKHVGVEGLVPELERSTSRLAFAMIIAALVIGSAMIIQARIGPALFGISIIGALGYLIAAISGLWLLIIIIRNRTLR